MTISIYLYRSTRRKVSRKELRMPNTVRASSFALPAADKHRRISKAPAGRGTRVERTTGPRSRDLTAPRAAGVAKKSLRPTGHYPAAQHKHLPHRAANSSKAIAWRAQGEADRLERSVAFFGAVDTRPHLFFLTVSLASIQRFHPLSGYFALIPQQFSARGSRWNALLHSWSSGRVHPLTLSAADRRHFAGAEGGYSPMTFHRHRVPEMLLARRFHYSVNLDPDVLCVRPWDLRFLRDVKLIGGRPVGTGARIVKWLQGRVGATARNGRGPEINVSSLLEQTLNISLGWRNAHRSGELNGGVLVFNNSAAVQWQWADTMAAHYTKLAQVIEGDQDLVGLVLLGNPLMPRLKLRGVYNYAFRRDRERLPYGASHRLRHGLVDAQVVNVHFVADGKPWQWQNLSAYPLWLLAARLHWIREWRALARGMTPRLASLRIGPWEQLHAGLMVGPALVARAHGGAGVGNELAGLTNADTLRRCRCFMRSLGRDKKADPSLLLRHAAEEEVPAEVTSSLGAQRTAASAALQPTARPGGAGASGGASARPHRPRRARGATVASEHSLDALERARMLVVARRRALLMACGDAGGAVPEDERAACDNELDAARVRFLCALAASEAGQPRYSREAANCSAIYASSRTP